MLRSADLEANEQLACSLRKLVGCAVVTGLQPKQYEAARQIWNMDASGHPDLIVQPTCTEDVARTVDFARRHGQTVCVRSKGAHSSDAMVTLGFGLRLGLGLRSANPNPNPMNLTL